MQSRHAFKLKGGEGRWRNARTVARGIIVTFCNPCRIVINPVVTVVINKEISCRSWQSIRQSIALCLSKLLHFRKKFHTALYNKTFWLLVNLFGQHLSILFCQNMNVVSRWWRLQVRNSRKFFKKIRLFKTVQFIRHKHLFKFRFDFCVTYKIL